MPHAIVYQITMYILMKQSEKGLDCLVSSSNASHLCTLSQYLLRDNLHRRQCWNSIEIKNYSLYPRFYSLLCRPAYIYFVLYKIFSIIVQKSTILYRPCIRLLLTFLLHTRTCQPAVWFYPSLLASSLDCIDKKISVCWWALRYALVISRISARWYYLSKGWQKMRGKDGAEDERTKEGCKFKFKRDSYGETSTTSNYST